MLPPDPFRDQPTLTGTKVTLTERGRPAPDRLEVYDFNPSARRVCEQAGFQVEGVLRDALRWDGEWVDATTMSIVAG